MVKKQLFISTDGESDTDAATPKEPVRRATGRYETEPPAEEKKEEEGHAFVCERRPSTHCKFNVEDVMGHQATDKPPKVRKSVKTVAAPTAAKPGGRPAGAKLMRRGTGLMKPQDPIFNDEQGEAFGAALSSAKELTEHRFSFAENGPKRSRDQRDPLRHADWSGASRPIGVTLQPNIWNYEELEAPTGQSGRLKMSSPDPVSRHWVQAAAEHWRAPPPPMETTVAEAHFLEALVTAPDNRLAWDAVRLVGMLRKQVEALRDDVRRAPTTYVSSRERATELAAHEFANPRADEVASPDAKVNIHSRFDDDDFDLESRNIDAGYRSEGAFASEGSDPRASPALT